MAKEKEIPLPWWFLLIPTLVACLVVGVCLLVKSPHHVSQTKTIESAPQIQEGKQPSQALLPPLIDIA